jgi:hypothetical protein
MLPPSVAVLCLVVLGCSRSDGPQRYRLIGEITYDGKPVPYGWIVFAPQKGPGASANIKDGKYITPDGFGSIGGLHTVEIVAFDGIATSDPNVEGATNPAGSVLFRHTLQKELPKEVTTWDIHLTSDEVEAQGE